MIDESDQVRQDIEATRGQLSQDVTALTERAKPSNMLRRRVQQLNRTLMGTKERVMESSSGLGAAGTSKVRSAMDSVTGAASAAPEKVRRQAEGNPLAVGLIAFGIGWLIGSLVPATRKERQLTDKVTDEVSERVQPLVKKAGDTAEQAMGQARRP